MTLIVSVPTNDGVVLAGDDLITDFARLGKTISFPFKCPKCGDIHHFSEDVTHVQPVSNFQTDKIKIMPFLEKYGIGYSGMSFIKGKGISYTTRLVEDSVRTIIDEEPDKYDVYSTWELAADVFSKHVAEDPILHDTDRIYLRLLMVGYDKYESQTMGFEVKRTGVTSHRYDTISTMFIGDTTLIKRITEVVKELGYDPPLDGFSLYDGKAYAKFLLRTAAGFHKYSWKPATVGSSTMLGVAVPFGNFEITEVMENT